jgi:YggT family protein
MSPIIYLLIQALDIYLWLVIITIVMSWLVLFGVLNTRNRMVYKFLDLLNRATNPVLMRIRKVIPAVGGMDFSPMVLMFGIYIIQNFLYGLLR